MRKLRRRLSIVGLLLFVAGLSSGAQTSRGRLFTHASPERQARAGDALGSLRSRLVRVETSALDEPGVGATASLTLELFQDVSVVADLDRIDRNLGGGYTWVGHRRASRDPVVFAVRDGIIAGNVTVGGRLYQVRSSGGAVHTVQEIDPAQFPPELDPVPVALPETYADAAAPAVPDGDSIIDVLVVYTADARGAVGGRAQMEALVDLAVSETNVTYANSGVSQRVRLVQAVEIAYVESGDVGVDLDRLTFTDGQMDSVHGLRDAYGADEVVLLVENGGAYCGIAWFMESVSSGFASYAFTVVDRSCATGNYTFGHELGHNMAARHDRYVDNANGPFSYNHGYVSVAGRWRTIMAYDSQCYDCGTSIPECPSATASGRFRW